MCKELRQILALEKLDKTIVYPKCAVIFDNMFAKKILTNRGSILELVRKNSHAIEFAKEISHENFMEKEYRILECLGVFNACGGNFNDFEEKDVIDKERPGASTSSPTRARDTDLESTNVNENVRRVASGKTINVTWKSVPVYKWNLKFSGEAQTVNAFMERVCFVV
ncbi:hypothetical protein FQA39_LY06745 [Lamprigera yunnana]|nr:hypothetical protein FQA39_LY06745 [Lamprigera yunnana]